MEPEFVYQGYVRQKIVNKGRTAVIAVPGAGKTRPIIDALVELDIIRTDKVFVDEKTFPRGPVLIMCSGPAVATWKRQVPQWSGIDGEEHIHVITGDAATRSAWWTYVAEHPGVYIINFAIFWRDIEYIKALRWGAIIADEYHKVMRSRKSATYKYFKSLTLHSDVMILASGSVISKDPSSMFTAFQLIAPKVFKSYWKFVGTYCIVNKGQFGTEILGVKNVQALHAIMDQYFAYVPEEVIADQLPTGRRSAFDVEMDKDQQGLYEELAEDMLAILEMDEGEGEDVVIIAPTVLTKLIRLRQLLCCPRMLDARLGMGGGFEAIVDTLEEEPHVVIFTPFRDACELIAAELTKRGYAAHCIMGGIGHTEQAERVEYFRTHRSILVCTIAYAESFDLETCKTSFFLGYSHLDANRQAEGRTRRAISEHEFVQWRYTRYKGTIDEDILLDLQQHAANVNKVMKRPQELIQALRGTSR